MGTCRPQRQLNRQIFRFIIVMLWGHGSNTDFRKPDITYNDFPCIFTAWIQYQPKLVYPKSNGAVSPDGRPQNGASSRMDPGGDIQRIDHCATSVHLIQYLFKNPLHLPGQPDAKYTIQQDVEIMLRHRCHRQNRNITIYGNLQLPLHFLCHMIRIANHCDGSGISLLAQKPDCRHTIAAIVSCTADSQYFPGFFLPIHNNSSYCHSCLLHQDKSRYPHRLNGMRINFLRLYATIKITHFHPSFAK